MPTTQIDSIRDAAVSALSAHGATDPVAESFLLRNLRLVGRKFSSANLKAIWLYETNVLQIIDENGRLIEAVLAEPPTEELPRAA